MKYRTKSGDVLDAICARHYGDTAFRLEDVIAANPGLAAIGPVLPAGLIINLPDIQVPAPQKSAVRLWD